MTLVNLNRPVQKDFNNVVDDFFNGIPALFNPGFNKSVWNGLVPVNVKENKDAYYLEVVAPGLDKNDFKVNIEGDTLTVSAEIKKEVKEDTDKKIRNEYSYRSFKRSFTLDEKVNAAAIEAKYVNGVLTLNLPKKIEVKEAAKEIEIK
ncbi:MAG: Hsp20/alpha crystallin family protein [Bacteroidota bacterium]